MLGNDPCLEDRFRAAAYYAPDHLPLEAANALRKYVRAGALDASAAERALNNVFGLGIRLVSAAEAARPAFRMALELNLSVHDAAYVVVADAMKVPLLTADKKLAAAYERSELIS